MKLPSGSTPVSGTAAKNQLRRRAVTARLARMAAVTTGCFLINVGRCGEVAAGPASTALVMGRTVRPLAAENQQFQI
jgi:hypothetical protein